MGSKTKRHCPNWNLFLIKYACWLLPVIPLFIPDERWKCILFVLSLPFVFIYISIFNWHMDKKSTAAEKRIKLLAHFWREGYFSIIPLLTIIIPSPKSFFYVVGGYGIYTFLIAAFRARHFVCGMQDAAHQPMRPYARCSGKDRRDGIIIGLFFLALSILGIYAD